MEAVKLKVHACLECGSVDEVHVGQTSVGCGTCKRFSVCTTTESAVTIWNLQNPAVETTVKHGLTVAKEDKRNYYKAEGKL